jgi:hypothetical protein
VKVSIEPHTLLRATERGATEEEIKDALENGVDILENQADWESVKFLLSGKSGMVSFIKRKNWKYSM